MTTQSSNEQHFNLLCKILISNTSSVDLAGLIWQLATTMLTARVLRVFLFIFSILAVAYAHPRPSKTTTVTVTATPTPTGGQCNTGPVQCCNSVEPASSGLVGTLLSLLGVVLEDLNIDIGVTCSPISIIGVGGSDCNASPVCCENNNFNGLIAIGCVPINISL
ncbi:hydrophobin [Pyrrhoderma noxium]|uniref:Hydrophobin n=1 Tax=Pyrrhoderma noxium TaxID=2282107 RepID=A0A286U5S2_9AGAM|nr:hydrophobin [Pyrrhoderma noxium]